MKLNKKAQITTFILIGVIILFVVGTLIFLQSNRDTSSIDTAPAITRPQHIQQVYSYVESCVEDIIPNGLFLLGAQGGFVNPPLNSLQTEEATIAYFLTNKQPTIPTYQVINNQLALYVRENLPKCTDFSTFPGMEIAPSQISSETIFTDTETIVKVNYPLSITKSGTTTELTDEYQVTFPLRFKFMYEKAREIVAMEVQDPENIDLVLLLDTDLDIGIIPEGDDIIYAITDKQSLIKGVPFTLLFANSF